MGFKQRLEEINAIMEQRPVRAVAEDVLPFRSIGGNSTVEVGAWGESWTEDTMSYFLGGIMDEMIKDGHIPELVESAIELVIDAAMVEMDEIGDADKDLSHETDIDAPPNALIPRGFKGHASGLAPTYVETQRRIAQQLIHMAPQSVGNLPVEQIKERWAAACGKLINMGKAISIETRKDGSVVIGPNYGLAWKVLKAQLDKEGIAITASKEKTIVKDAEDLVKKSAQTLSAMARSGEVSAKSAKASSSMMRGAKERKARKGA